MAQETIVCPRCGNKIKLTEAITHQFESKLRKKIEQEVKKEQDKRLAGERDRIMKGARKQAKQSVAMEMSDLKDQLGEKSKALEAAKKQELTFRKRQRELEEKERNIELEVERTLDRERQKIREEAEAKVIEEHHLRDREKDKQMTDMRKQIEELQRKAEQGSQQTRGEVLELELEDILRSNFPHDIIEPIAKGKRGADVLQRVYTRSGQQCGAILWESKLRQAWSPVWIEKLKDDQREAKADLGVIVSEILPKGVNHFGYVDGVWATDLSSVVGLATALRVNLIQVTQARAAHVGKSEKMELLYNYLSGLEFRQRVQAIVESFVGMKTDLESEKRAMEKVWAKREKQIHRAVNNIAGMYGDLEGIVSLPPINILELPPGEDSGLEEL